MESKPLVSVVMAVYNGKNTVERAINSILNQTFTDFEFIIVDDGSNDNTYRILQKYERRDKRITIIKNPTNIGLTKSLNKGIKMAKGKYIARQDADDESLPERLEKQVEFMENNSEIVLLGANQYEVNKKAGSRIGRYYNISEINRVVYLRNPIPHTSVIFRKDLFLKIGLYDESFATSQDFEAWMRMAKVGKIAMLKEPLVKRYAENENSISIKKRFLRCINHTRACFKHPNQGLLKAFLSSLYYWIMAYMPRYIIKLKRRFFNNLFYD